MLKRRDLQMILDIIEPNSNVLDLGCGDGQLLNELIKKKNVKGFGIEISLERIKKCLERGVSVVQEDLNEGLKDFQDKSFDYVVLSQTLEDISNPAYLIHEMLRVGNKCIISFENIAFWKNRFSFLINGTLKKNERIEGLINSKKQQFLTINRFLRFCEIKKYVICKKIFISRKKLNLLNIFPNFFSKMAIFILKGIEFNNLQEKQFVSN